MFGDASNNHSLACYFRITSHLLKNPFLGDERQGPLSGTKEQPFPGANDPSIFPSGISVLGYSIKLLWGHFL